MPKPAQLTGLVTCQVYFPELLPDKVQAGMVQPEEPLVTSLTQVTIQGMVRHVPLRFRGWTQPKLKGTNPPALCRMEGPGREVPEAQIRKQKLSTWQFSQLSYHE